MRILVDMDAIVVDLFSEWCRAYNAAPSIFSDTEDDTLDIANVTEWNIGKFVRNPRGLFAILERPGFFDYLPAIPGAVKGVTALIDAGHEIRFATAPPSGDAARGKIEWVKREFTHRGLTQRHVMFSHDKDWIQADAIIDDRPKTIAAWSEMGKRVATIEYPYNVTEAGLSRVFNAGHYTNPEDAWANIVDHFTT